MSQDIEHREGAEPHRMPLRDLARHALIVGSTGSGKSVTTQLLLQELNRNAIPFLVVESAKKEYFEGLSPYIAGPLISLGFDKPSATERETTIWVGGKPRVRKRDLLAFDPLRLPAKTSVARHVSYLKGCFQAAFPLPEIMAMLLEAGLLEYYITPYENDGCGLEDIYAHGGSHIAKFKNDENGKPQVWPSFATFSAYFIKRFLPTALGTEGGPPSAWALETAQAFKRRFHAIQQGLLGKAFERADREFLNQRQKTGSVGNGYEYLSHYLRSNCILELDALADPEQKSLVMAFVLSFVFEYRQAAGRCEDPRGLTHFLVIEEAHRLLSGGGGGSRGEVAGQSANERSVSLFTDMLAEIRAYGQGVGIVEQIPSKITPDAIKNTNLKIMLRMTSPDDRNYLGEAMTLSEEQKRFAASLRAQPGKGIEYILFREGVENPLLIKLPMPPAGESPTSYLSVLMNSIRD